MKRIQLADAAGTGAHNRIRTDDLILTKDVLYLLSYVGPLQLPAGQQRDWSGKRDSNPRPSAWKADALAS